MQTEQNFTKKKEQKTEKYHFSPIKNSTFFFFCCYRHSLEEVRKLYTFSSGVWHIVLRHSDGAFWRGGVQTHLMSSRVWGVWKGCSCHFHEIYTYKGLKQLSPCKHINNGTCNKIPQSKFTPQGTDLKKNWTICHWSDIYCMSKTVYTCSSVNCQLGV